MIGFLVAPLQMYAGIYGTLKGRVVDDKKQPLVGIVVQVVGTGLGANTDADGRFYIVKINPATYNVKVSGLGLADKNLNVEVTADIVIDLGDIEMSNYETQTAIVVAKNFKQKQQGTIADENMEDANKLPGGGVFGVVGISSGVLSTGNGWSIRGARSSETQIRLDGLDIGNQFTGGFGLVGRGLYPMVSQYATERVQVIKGGFSAEYGDVLGGVVNTTIKNGSTERYEGYVAYSHDLDALWGSQKAGIKLVRESEGSRLKAIDYGEGYQLQGGNNHDIQAGFGGPLPFLNKSTFYLSGTYNFSEYSGGYDIRDPWGSSKSNLPNDNTWVKNITGRVKFALSDNINFILGGTFGMTNLENMNYAALYTDDEGILDYRINDKGEMEVLKTNGIPEYIAKMPVVNQNTSNIMVRMNHTLSDKSYYEITLSRNTNDDELARRVSSSDPDFFSGFEMMYPVDDLTIFGSTLVPGNDGIIDFYTPISRVGRTKDKYFLIDQGFLNPLTGYIEGDVDVNTANNPYGFIGSSYAHVNSSFQFRKGTYWQVDGNYNLDIPNITKDEFNHSLRTGFELRFYEARRHSNSNPWDGNPFVDVYTEEWGGNFYAKTISKETAQETYDFTSKGYFPFRASAYVQDQITYKGIIISPGLRFDMFDPQSIYRVNTNSSGKFISIEEHNTDLFAEVSPKIQVSPRLNISYPITEASFLSIAYGICFKMPEIQYLYDNFNKYLLRGNELLGEPNMEAQRTNQYQIAYSNRLTDQFSLDITAYYRDIYNQLGIAYYEAVPDAFSQYAVADYGNAKGVEFQLRKDSDLRNGDPLSFRLDYTLGYITGTSANVTSNYLRSIDEYTEKYTVPLVEYPLPQDIRHRANASVTYQTDRHGLFAIGDFYPLEMSYLTLTGSFSSGSPYTPLNGSGYAIAEPYSERQPSVWNFSLKFSKTFLLADIFGESMGNTSLEIFFDVYNLFNFNEAIGFYGRTGDPIDDGASFDYRIGNFSAQPFYKQADFLIAETVSSIQYNRYGDRLYSNDADLDGNGMVSQDEKLRSYEKWLEDRIATRGNFQQPRTVYFGFKVDF